MHHVLHNSLVKGWVHSRIRQLGADDLVIIVCRSQLVVRVEDDEDVGMGEAALLELDGVDVGNRAPQDATLQQVLEHLLELEPKTRLVMSGRSAAVCPGSSADWISGQLGLQVMVMK